MDEKSSEKLKQLKDKIKDPKIVKAIEDKQVYINRVIKK